MLLGHPKFTPAYGAQLLRLAIRTAWYDIDGLGLVRLDTFLVNQRAHRPGDGHWAQTTSSDEDWDRTFHGATVIE